MRLGVARYDRILRDGDPQRVLAFLGDSSFADWLGPVPSTVDAIVRPTLQRSAGEPEDLSAGYGIGYFHLVWDRRGGLARNILGGPSTLVEAIASALGERVRLLARGTQRLLAPPLRARAEEQKCCNEHESAASHGA